MTLFKMADQDDIIHLLPIYQHCLDRILAYHNVKVSSKVAGRLRLVTVEADRQLFVYTKNISRKWLCKYRQALGKFLAWVCAIEIRPHLGVSVCRFHSGLHLLYKLNCHADNYKQPIVRNFFFTGLWIAGNRHQGEHITSVDSKALNLKSVQYIFKRIACFICKTSFSD